MNFTNTTDTYPTVGSAATAHTLQPIADTEQGDPTRHYETMITAISPILSEGEAITGIFDELPVLLRAFRAFNGCDLVHMMECAVECADETRAVDIARLALLMLYKTVELSYDTVNTIVCEQPNCTVISAEDATNVIDLLTELNRVKWKMIHTLEDWINHCNPDVGVAIMKARHKPHTRLAYRGFINGWFYKGHPSTSMDAKENDGYTEEEVFDHCFANPDMRGFIWASIAREFRVSICGELAKDVFGKRGAEIVEDAMDVIFGLGDENDKMFEKIEENQRRIADAKMRLDGVGW